jgi:tetratricopeptide (TPR) repeat protein
MFGNFLLAQSSAQAEDSLSENYPRPHEQTHNANLTWPLLSGESVGDLATLFYPNNKKMQRLFISKTLQLNHVVYPDMEASSKSNQASLIVIPNIKLLAKSSRDIKLVSLNAMASTQRPTHSRLDMSDAAKSSPDSSMQAAYDELLKKNEFIKQELETLKVQLAHLQEVLVALKMDVERFQARAFPLPAAISLTVEAVAPSSQTQPSVIKNNVTKTAKTVAHDAHNKAVATPVIESESILSSSVARYLIMMLILLIAAIGGVFSIRLYNRRQTKNLSIIAADGLGALATTKSFSDTHSASSFTSSFNGAGAIQMVSESSGILTDEDLDSTKALYDEEDSKLVLAQARIYANINREDEAIALLKAQIQLAPKTTLDHWLYLLDIYRATNQKEAFLQSAATLHQQFNVMVPLWDDAPAAMVVASSLEAFPHIVQTLTSLWAESEKVNEKLIETKAYLDKLLMDNRDSERTGFGMEVFQEILFLRSLLDTRDKLKPED